MRRAVVFIMLILAMVSSAVAQTGIRPIGSVQWDIYFNNNTRQELTGRSVEKNVFNINAVSIFPFTPTFSLESKIQFQATTWAEPTAEGSKTLEQLVADGQIREDWWKLTVSPAGIIVVPPFYFILRPAIAFGNGLDSTGERITLSVAPEGTIDANLETARWYANLAFRGALYRDQGLWFIIPSGGVTHTFPGGFRLGGKLFYSRTSNTSGGTTVPVITTEWATLIDTEIPLNDRTRLVLGGTLSWSPIAGAPGGRNLFERVLNNNDFDASAFVGVSLPATDSIRLKYQAEPIIRGNAGPGLSNVFVLDARL